jgi:curved DNA-binding protein
LYVKITIKPSDIFSRKGDDLYYVAPMNIFTLVLGGKISIPHPEWSIEVAIPKWTQITSKIKVSNKGFGDTWFFASRWDLYIVPSVSIPKKLSKKDEELREKLRDSSQE